jgi:hypothetical protein
MEQLPQSETFGEVFAEFMIELVANDTSPKGVDLLCWDGTQAHIQSRVELIPALGSKFKPRAFDSPDLDSSIRRAIRIPTHAAAYDSSRALFSDLCSLVIRFTDLPEKHVQLASHAILASWFSECTAVPIWLSIVGPRSSRGSQLFRLLSCLYRRPLVLGEMSLSRFYSLPMDLCPSLFIERYEYSREVDRFLRATNAQDAYVPRKGRLATLSGPRVICSEEPFYDSALGGGGIDIPITPAHQPLPILDKPNQQQIANDFQPKLLMYRLRNHRRVVESKYDVPEFLSPVRELARCLGACVPDEPELQRGIGSLLGELNEELEADRAIDLNAAVVEAMLCFCHGKARQFARVAEITNAVNAILERSGELLELKPRTIGYKLKALGLTTKRLDAAGRGMPLLRATRALIHRLARDYAVLAGRGNQECSDCEHVSQPEGDETPPTAELGEGSPAE